MTVVRKYDSLQGGMKGIRKVCPLMERCAGHEKAIIGSSFHDTIVW